MKNYKILFVVLSLAVTSVLRAQIPPEKRQEIEKMMRLTGMEKLVHQMEGQMLANFRANMTNVPADFWDKFAAKLDSHEFIEMIMPIYDKYYSLEDLKAVNDFYSSPVGQRILATLPQVMQESMKVGQTWGQKMAARAQEEVAAAAAAKDEKK